MKYYLTTPIYYVNDMPHIGHAYTTVAADVLARWHRLRGDDVFFLTGTDEHGAKIVQAAEKAEKSPKEFCDGIVAGFREAWERLKITNDGFVRTTDPVHEKVVQEFLERLHRAGAVYKGRYEGLYCVQCEKFLSESDLNEDLCCPDHRQKPVRHAEENYFFRLSDYRDRLLKILTDESRHDHLAVFPLERRNEIVGKLKVGLEDISISRAALEWGVPLPFDPSQTAYVWIDALLNYVSAVGYGADDRRFEKLWPADLHLMAKDILWFHSVIWPAMLMAADLPLPKKVFAHGFFTIDGGKMSKTLGNVIRPADLAEKFGADPARYLLLSLFPFGTDGDISWAGLTQKYNVDLANNFGNLVSRTATMVGKYFDGRVPDTAADTTLTEKVRGALAEIPPLMEGLEFHRVADRIQDAVNAANGFIEEKAPWKMAKEQDPALGAVMFSLLETIGLVTMYLVPFMPEKTQAVWESIGKTGPVEEAARGYFAGAGDVTVPEAGAAVTKAGILFPRFNA